MAKKKAAVKKVATKKIETKKVTEKKPECLVNGCDKPGKLPRGLCTACLSEAERAIKAEVVSWEKLVDMKLALPLEVPPSGLFATAVAEAYRGYQNEDGESNVRPLDVQDAIDAIPKKKRARKLKPTENPDQIPGVQAPVHPDADGQQLLPLAEQLAEQTPQENYTSEEEVAMYTPGTGEYEVENARLAEERRVEREAEAAERKRIRDVTPRTPEEMEAKHDAQAMAQTGSGDIEEHWEVRMAREANKAAQVDGTAQPPQSKPELVKSDADIDNIDVGPTGGAGVAVPLFAPEGLPSQMKAPRPATGSFPPPADQAPHQAPHVDDVSERKLSIHQDTPSASPIGTSNFPSQPFERSPIHSEAPAIQQPVPLMSTEEIPGKLPWEK